MTESKLLPADAPVTAFDGQRLVARGPLRQVLDIVARYEVREAGARVEVFQDLTGEVLARETLVLAPAATEAGSASEEVAPRPVRRPGRPRLGVVAREITLLPEQWRWLGQQSGGASATLRRLIDDARAQEAERERRRLAHGAAWRCLATLGRGLTGVDDALLAIFTGDAARYEQSSLTWPVDVRDYLRDIGFGQVRAL